MSELFILDEREFNLWQSQFVSKIEKEWKNWKIPVDTVQVLLILQSRWLAVIQQDNIKSERNNEGGEFFVLFNYKQFIFDLAESLISNPNIPESAIEQLKLNFNINSDIIDE